MGTRGTRETQFFGLRNQGVRRGEKTMEIEAGGRFFVEPAVSAEARRRQQAKDEPNLARPS